MNVKKNRGLGQKGLKRQIKFVLKKFLTILKKQEAFYIPAFLVVKCSFSWLNL